VGAVEIRSEPIRSKFDVPPKKFQRVRSRLPIAEPKISSLVGARMFPPQVTFALEIKVTLGNGREEVLALDVGPVVVVSPK
jgi:hypothetical protein